MYDEDVFAALRGSLPADPVGIPDILQAVDARQRLVLTLDELNESLASLIHEGRAQQVRPGFFAAGRGSQALTPVVKSQFDAALAEYQGRFDGVSAGDDDDDSGTMLKLCFTTTTKKPSTRALDDFTEALERNIGSVADVLGFEMGSDVVELHILVDEGEPVETVAAACALAASAWDQVDGYRIVIADAEGNEREYP